MGRGIGPLLAEVPWCPHTRFRPKTEPFQMSLWHQYGKNSFMGLGDLPASQARDMQRLRASQLPACQYARDSSIQ